MQDDNLRLHRISFLFLWTSTFVLAWYVIYIYELLWYEPRLDRFLSWLKFSSTWREGAVIGLLFGGILSVTQTWIIRFRFGFSPRFWLPLTLIGSIVAGQWYPRVGLRTGEALIGINWMGVNNTTSVDKLVIDFMLWFLILNLCQTIALFFVNRKAVVLIIVGLVSGFIASIPMVYPHLMYGRPFWTLILATGFQAIASYFVVMYCMSNPRMGVTPKRDKQVPNLPRQNLSTVTFILMWVASFHIARVVNIIIPEIWRFLVYYSPTALYENLRLSQSFDTWIYALIVTGISGIWLAIAQKWLMSKYANIEVSHWIIFSAIGWMIAEFILWYAQSIYPRDSTYYLFMGLYWILPALLQAILINRLASRGWIWLFSGVIAGIISIWILSIEYPYLSRFYSTFVATMSLAFSTSICFVYLRNHLRNPTESSDKQIRAGTEFAS